VFAAGAADGVFQRLTLTSMDRGGCGTVTPSWDLSEHGSYRTFCLGSIITQGDLPGADYSLRPAALMKGNIEIRFHLNSDVLALPMGPGRHIRTTTVVSRK
jgi:hypothetical protein